MGLLNDRYFTDDSQQVWDLTTGRVLPGGARPQEPAGSDPPLAPLVEVLEHGQEGAPRSIVLDALPSEIPGLVRRASTDARGRGFVPVAVEAYLRLRDALRDGLDGRALLLIAADTASADRGWAALLDAAARSARPHVLLTLRPPAQYGARHAREARPVYGAGRLRAVGRVSLVDADAQHQLRRAERAGAFIREGRHAAAERLLRDVAAALARRRQPGPAAQVLLELGQAVLERGRAADADRLFEQAAVSAASASEATLAIDARIWQSAARTDAGRLPDAESLCRAVLAGRGLDGGQQAHARAVLARVLIWQRRVPEAVALDLADVGGEAPCVRACYVEAMAVRVLIAGGRLFDAGVRVRRLLDAVDDADPDVTCRLLASVAHLRLLIAAGDLGLADTALQALLTLARTARAPLRAARARLIWAEGLLRAGRLREARTELRRLQRLSGAAAPLLRRAVRQAIRATECAGSPAVSGTVPAVSEVSTASRLVALAYEEESDVEAVRRVLELCAALAQASRIDVCSADAGPTSTLFSVGGGLPTRLGARVLDAGLTLGPEAADHGYELGVPVRRGVRLCAAIVARWPADRTPPESAAAQLELAAAVVCPRIEAMLATARVSAATAAAVPELIGASEAIAGVRAAIGRAAATPFSVLIHGESGVGKELVARAIHHLSPRRERPFCDINCAALPDDLLESELFGHTRGAFTGAVSDRPGLFEEANGGTVFLDELADLSPRAQAKLLRVLQQHEVRRVGETFSRTVDVRLVTAANRDLAAEVDGGRFRQDLLYRLDVIRLRIPPLRERPGDVPLLAQHFWQSASARVGTSALLTHGVLAALSRYHWPGNVRELQNVMAALAVAAPARGLVRVALLPPVIAGAAVVTSTRLADARAQFERRAIESALARAAGSRTRAARELGLSRQGLLKMMARLGLA